ncbi:hypothetical protein RB601_007306 [Gaeumannomyces tritici]
MENGAMTQGEGKDPTSFLSDIIGNMVTVKLNSGVIYKGELQSVDGYMNIALEKAEEWVAGQKKRSYGDAFVRGNNGGHHLFGLERLWLYAQLSDPSADLLPQLCILRPHHSLSCAALLAARARILVLPICVNPNSLLFLSFIACHSTSWILRDSRGGKCTMKNLFLLAMAPMRS